MECQEEGLTTFLPTIIPHFKRVVVSSFRCEHCGHRNTECMIADFSEKGCRYVLKAKGPEDLNRQVLIAAEPAFVAPSVPGFAEASILRHTSGARDNETPAPASFFASGRQVQRGYHQHP
eukprot:SAG31_NODE_127_length_23612_cov_39.709863_16_plen_120_part_00